MSARNETEWEFRQVNEGAVGTFAEALSVHPATARVLLSRGIDSVDHAARFFNPRLADLSAPHRMAELDRALERIARAITKRERIGVFGDYDVDGITSSVIVADFLEACGVSPITQVACRDFGYGFTETQARRFVEDGCRVIILTDCGTHDVETIRFVAQHQIDVITVDHHRIESDFERVQWPGYALINPQRPDCGFVDKTLCSAGLSFFLVAALRRYLEQTHQLSTEHDPREALDLVALGTIADVAELSPQNRILVARGLQRLTRTRRAGLRELIRLAELENKTLSTEDVGFRLGPRLNAPGRLGTADMAVACLRSTGDVKRAIEGAKVCDALNQQRKEIQEAIWKEALAMAERSDSPFLLVGGEAWHAGVSGIIAARLAERFHRPTAVVVFEGDVGRGSARSVPGVDLYALLTRASHCLERFGGHASAAGFSVSRDKFALLGELLNAATVEALHTAAMPTMLLDGVLDISTVNSALCQEFNQLAPFGNGNPEPVFAAKRLKVEQSRIVGERHLSLVLRHESTVRNAIAFGLSDRRAYCDDAIDIAFYPELDLFRGGTEVRLRIAALRRAR